MRQLAALVVAQRVVLFYAQSGVGKTSLLQAGLIPHLQEKRRVDVLPVTRVGGQGSREQSLGADGNIFVFNLLSDLYSDSHWQEDRPKNLADLSLRGRDYPPFCRTARMAARPRPSIIDQFEEFFTAHGNHPQDRSDFFRQLQETLAATPRLTLLLAMREDYVPSLDFYTVQMPDRLRSRFRMERLGESGALEAIVEPARLAGRDFDAGVAEQLVRNLRLVQTRRLGDAVSKEGAAATELGDYVEPVHLQIVCQELWDRLPADRHAIQLADLTEHGNVDDALSRFYERAVDNAVAETGINPRQIRAWFGEKLITSAHTRSLLFQGEQTTEGLPNGVVAVLRRSFIVREVVRGGDLFYELAHDRLVEPILTANQRFHEQYFNPLAGVADRWAAAGRSADLLLGGAELTTAQRFARTHTADLLPVESDFLAAGLRRRTQRRWMGLIAVSVTAVILAVATFAAIKTVQGKEIELERERQQGIANSRMYASQAQAAIDKGQGETGTELALKAGGSSSTAEAFAAIRRALNAEVQLVHVMDGGQGRPIMTIGWAEARQQLAAGDHYGYLWLWDLTTGQPLWSTQAHTDTIGFLDWRPDDALLVSAGADGAVRLWQPQDGTEIRDLAQFEGEAVAAGWNLAGDRLAAAGGQSVKIWDEDGATLILTATQAHTATLTLAEWSPDGRYFLSADESGGLILWDGQSGRLVHRLVGHSDKIKDIDWLPEQNLLLTGGLDERVIVWDLATGGRKEEFASDVGGIIFVRWHPDGQRFLMVGKKGAASLWGSDGGGSLVRYQLASNRERMETVAWLQNGAYLLSGDHDGHIRIWDVESGAIVNFLVGHSAAVQQVLVYPGEERFLSAGKEVSSETGSEGTVRLWDVGKAREIQVLQDHVGGIQDVSWGRNQSEFVSVGGDGVMRLYTTVAELEIPVIQAANGRVFSANWIDDESRILTGGGSNAAIWNAKSGENILNISHDEPIWSVRLRADGHQIIAASEGGHAHIWDADSGKEITTLVHPGDSTAYAMEYTRWDAGVIVAGDTQGTISLWDPETLTMRCMIQVTDTLHPANPPKTAGTIRFQKADGPVVTSSHNGRVTMWDSRTCTWMYELPTNFTDAYEALWNKPRTQVLAYGEGDTPLIWDAEKEAVVAYLVDDQAPGMGAVSAAWNADESAVLAAGSDNIVRLWDARTGKLRKSLASHDGRITTATWIKNGSQILTASYDGLLRISDAQSGLPLVTLRGHTDWVTGATYRTLTDPNSGQSWDMVLSWSRDGTVRLWRIDAEKQTAEIYAVLDSQSGIVNGAALNAAGDQVMAWGDDGMVRRYYVYMADLLAAVCRNNAQLGQSEACRPAQE